MPLPCWIWKTWIWKTDRAGTIALAVMLLMEACLLVLLVARACGAITGRALEVAGGVGLVLLSFPFGWLGELVFGGMSVPPWHLAVSLPFNAYFWGNLFAIRAASRQVGLPPGGPAHRADRELPTDARRDAESGSDSS